MTTTELLPLILLGGGAFLLIGAAVHFTGVGSLNNIKSKTVGDGQHGTARWATKQEIQKTYRHIPFRPDRWRQGEDLPTAQGLVLGCVGGRGLRKPGKLADKVRRAKKDGLIDNFIYGSVSATYLSAVIDAL